MLSPRHAGLLAVGLSFSSPAVLAQQGWELCPLPKGTDIPNKIQRPANLDALAVYIEANSALFRDKGTSELLGDVLISRADRQLRADSAAYNRETQQVTAEGDVRFNTATLDMSSDKLDFNLETGAGTIDNTRYSVLSADGRGSSTRLVQQADGLTLMEDASYTTCPVGTDSWSIQADDIELDHAKEEGTARNVTLRVNNTPILYLPYFSFPLTDRRKSGLLMPSFGTDEKSGVRISLPYYFNLAPNYDLTLTTNWLSKRGLQEEFEFRYLLNKHKGNLQYEIVPNDNNYANRLRYFFNVDHQSQLGPNSKLTLKAAGVSDTDYFDDLGASLASSSIVNLERTLSYTTQKGNWSFSALAQGYQVLDNTSAAYSRLPQLQLNWHPDKSAAGFEFNASSEYTYFDKSSADNGQRFDIQASVQRRFANEYAYVTPALKLHHTHYQLEGSDSQGIERSLPTASLDAGIFLERELDQGKRIQTLEPRIYYTYTPFRDQSAIPVFDSSERTLSYSQLFSDNRFTGKDRIADTNRLSTSLTTRLQDVEKGREILRASVGQILYFNDRKVTLPDESAQTATRSELVMEFSGDLNDSTRLSGTGFIDTEERQLTASQLRINYSDKKNRVLNLAYSQRKGEYQAARFSFATPVTDQWKVVGGHEQDLENDRMLETLAGIEYQSCCWKGRLAARKYLLSDNKTYDDAIFAEVELKGLGNFGSGTRNLLENRIYGYE